MVVRAVCDGTGQVLIKPKKYALTPSIEVGIILVRNL